MRAGEAQEHPPHRAATVAVTSPAKTAAVLILEVDGRYSQHLPVMRGEGPTEYAVSLGRLAAGRHRLDIRLDREIGRAHV